MKQQQRNKSNGNGKRKGKPMGIQKKFALLAGVAGVILALIAVTGYYLSYRMLSDSVQNELSAGMETRSTALDGWLEGKEQLAVAAANLMAKTDDGTKSPEELRCSRGAARTRARSLTSSSATRTGRSSAITRATSRRSCTRRKCGSTMSRRKPAAWSTWIPTSTR